MNGRPSVRLWNGKRCTLLFNPLLLMVGVAYQSVAMGKYPQDRLRLIQVTFPFFCLTIALKSRPFLKIPRPKKS